jgi:hypothetical protein
MKELTSDTEGRYGDCAARTKDLMLITRYASLRSLVRGRPPEVTSLPKEMVSVKEQLRKSYKGEPLW